MSVKDRSHFSTRFLLLLFAVAVIALVGLGSFLVWSAQRIDADAYGHESELLKRGIAELAVNMKTAQQDIAVWDEAVSAYERGDSAWLAENLGNYAYQTYGHNRLYLVDSEHNPVMAVHEGGHVAPETSVDTIDRLKPLLQQLRTLDVQAAISAFNEGNTETPPNIVEFTLVDGHPALVGAMPLLSLSGSNPSELGSEAIFISVVLLDAEMANYMGTEYLVDNPAFTLEKPAGTTAVPVVDGSGQTIAWLDWNASRPGSHLISDTLPALVAGVLIMALIIVQLLRSLRRVLKQLQAEREEAHERALRDPLTGLGNRSMFRATLESCFAPPNDNQPRLALLALDLDHFKEVNDSMGHAAGDELLTLVARRLAPLLSPNDTLIRLGGDEFAVIQPGIFSHDEPIELAKKIVAELSKPMELSSGSATIGVSVGIATAWDVAKNAEDLERFADDALYRAKNSGRNRYCLYGPTEINEPSRQQNELRGAFSTRRA
ncbi:diguanylate cyclase [Devosia sp. Leaf64]|uniref:sensor domain-containing diguanylate cyclase n=1 Tax=Devosia sp. Leaf64 TaxID=1736229 RepID=UPI00071461FB|nr:diguanylate cyclase [Devosia sp. Leaf64]KQN69860.1 hypothetical protein ASE94_12225 [Devosia sp. Leaf64]